MYNQGPTIGGINPSFSGAPDEQNPPQPKMGQPVPGMPAYPQGPVHTGVTVQPAVFMTSTPTPTHLPDYLGYSIFTLVCCCFPLGIAAVIYSVSTRNANMAGERDLATRSSRTTLILNHVSLGLGLAAIAIYLLIILLLLHQYNYI
ncbi:hypothetical protein R3I93_020062 [Phoxinus phoxinus]|uniref:Synapse differentiation-inducing gene protein 1-like n=1 Tax=Phoxinus phoxinus TaxID=58324 RepID=A0AAN9GSU2_9TELE